MDIFYNHRIYLPSILKIICIMNPSTIKRVLLTIPFTFSLLCMLAQDTPATKDTINNKEADVIFTRVEVEANYPGGNAGWRDYLVKNLRGDAPVDNNAPGGTYQVIVRFIVDKDSTISEVVSETKHGYGMEAEVIRVIKKSGKWNPAYQNGRPVKAYRRQPVTFVVPEEPKKKN